MDMFLHIICFPKVIRSILKDIELHKEDLKHRWSIHKDN